MTIHPAKRGAERLRFFAAGSEGGTGIVASWNLGDNLARLSPPMDVSNGPPPARINSCNAIGQRVPGWRIGFPIRSANG